jgi:hypothetical protein
MDALADVLHDRAYLHDKWPPITEHLDEVWREYPL